MQILSQCEKYLKVPRLWQKRERERNKVLSVLSKVYRFTVMSCAADL